MLEAIVALPDQLFYNTGIATYVWIVTNRKPKNRRGKIQLINAVGFYNKMTRSLGNKRNEIGESHIETITKIYGDFRENEFSKIYDNEDFGYWRITVERPLRLNFQTSKERIESLKEETAFKNLAASKKKGEAGLQEVKEGRKQQQAIVDMLLEMDSKLYKNREEFTAALKKQISASGMNVSAPLFKSFLNALSERDETAEICRDAKGNPEPDSELRDYESVPLKENIQKL